jgi:hypothetical protein
MGAEGGHVTACGMTTFSEIWQSSPLDGRFSRAILMIQKVDLRLGTQSSFFVFAKTRALTLQNFWQAHVRHLGYSFVHFRSPPPHDDHCQVP